MGEGSSGLKRGRDGSGWSMPYPPIPTDGEWTGVWRGGVTIGVMAGEYGMNAVWDGPCDMVGPVWYGAGYPESMRGDAAQWGSPLGWCGDPVPALPAPCTRPFITGGEECVSRLRRAMAETGFDSCLFMRPGV